MLPVAEDLVTVIHSTTLAAARSISHEGISKAGRLHVHFYESDLEGRPTRPHPPVRLTSEVIIVVSAERCGRFELVFYRASDGVILNPDLEGMVANECILCVRRLPDYEVLWSSLSQRWGSRSTPVLGTRFSAGKDRKRTSDRLQPPRGRWDSAGSSSDVSPQRNPDTDEVETPCYTVETVDQRKKAWRMQVDVDQSPVTSGNEVVTRTVTREVLGADDQVMIEEEATVLQMHMGAETGTASTTIAR